MLTLDIPLPDCDPTRIRADPVRGRWYVYIDEFQMDDYLKALGTFATQAEAVAVRDELRVRVDVYRALTA